MRYYTFNSTFFDLETKTLFTNQPHTNLNGSTHFNLNSSKGWIKPMIVLSISKLKSIFS